MADRIPPPPPGARLEDWQAYQAARTLEQIEKYPWRSHRTPPRPPFEHHPGKVCRLCGEAVTGRRRRWCSDACVDLWNVVAEGRIAHYHLVTLHGWRCWSCGEPAPELEVEHVRPLWSLTLAERCDLRWWLPYNLQLLCIPCHRAKSAAEARDRAAIRRGQAPPPPGDGTQMVLV